MPSKYLAPGHRIVSRGTTIEISSVGTELGFRVLSVDGPFARYLDAGRNYTARQLTGYGKEEIWEVPPEQMKRSVSQVLIYCDEGIGPMLDLDG